MTSNFLLALRLRRTIIFLQLYLLIRKLCSICAYDKMTKHEATASEFFQAEAWQFKTTAVALSYIEMASACAAVVP